MAQAELDPAVSIAAQDRTNVPSLATDPLPSHRSVTDVSSIADEMLWDHAYDPVI
jgi:hypothetical protein